MELIAQADSKSASIIYVEGVGHFVKSHVVDELREENEALRALINMKESTDGITDFKGVSAHRR